MRMNPPTNSKHTAEGEKPDPEETYCMIPLIHTSKIGQTSHGWGSSYL